MCRGFPFARDLRFLLTGRGESPFLIAMHINDRILALGTHLSKRQAASQLL